MTDPLALDPVLPARERSMPRLEFKPGMSDDERYRHFEEHVHRDPAIGQRREAGSLRRSADRHAVVDRREALSGRPA